MRAVALEQHVRSKPASKKLKTTGELFRITTNSLRAVSSRLARSMADLVSKSGGFGDAFQDNRSETSGRTFVYRVGFSNEGRLTSIAIGPSKECKWVGNEACAMPWCHGVGDFQVKTSRFSAIFQDIRPGRGGTSAKQAGFAPL